MALPPSPWKLFSDSFRQIQEGGQYITWCSSFGFGGVADRKDHKYNKRKKKGYRGFGFSSLVWPVREREKESFFYIFDLILWSIIIINQAGKENQ